jgi:hypothetical protein
MKLPPKHSHPHALKHTNSSVVITTAILHENGNGNGNGFGSVQGEEELRQKPRGFFADQFEVRFQLSPCSRTETPVFVEPK